MEITPDPALGIGYGTLNPKLDLLCGSALGSGKETPRRSVGDPASLVLWRGAYDCKEWQTYHGRSAT